MGAGTAHGAPHEHDQEREREPHAFRIANKCERKAQAGCEDTGCRALYGMHAVYALFEEAVHTAECADCEKCERRITESQPAHDDRHTAESGKRGTEKAKAVLFEQTFAPKKVRRSHQGGRKQHGNDAKSEGTAAEHQYTQKGQKHRERTYVRVGGEDPARIEIAEQDVIDLHERVHLILRKNWNRRSNPCAGIFAHRPAKRH